jgi:hypothetical protein
MRSSALATAAAQLQQSAPSMRRGWITPIALVRAWLLLRATSRHATARPPCTRHGRRRQRPRVCWTADSSKHDHVLRTHGPCRGSLRPRSPGCRLAGRSGHLIADGPRAAPNRPLRASRRGQRRLLHPLAKERRRRLRPDRCLCSVAAARGDGIGVPLGEFAVVRLTLLALVAERNAAVADAMMLVVGRSASRCAGGGFCSWRVRTPFRRAGLVPARRALSCRAPARWRGRATAAPVPARHHRAGAA